jgi:hypothetical protein
MNFLIETQEAIKESGHTTGDVMFVGSDDGRYRMTWGKFSELADFKYDSGLGIPLIASDLIIYFYDNTYIKRIEYDGSEWWDIHKPKLFHREDKHEDFDILKLGYYGQYGVGKMIEEYKRRKQAQATLKLVVEYMSFMDKSVVGKSWLQYVDVVKLEKEVDDLRYKKRLSLEEKNNENI